MGTIRFETHHTEPRGPYPPQGFVPALLENERVVAVESVVDELGHAAARVWIERVEA